MCLAWQPSQQQWPLAYGLIRREFSGLRSNGAVLLHLELPANWPLVMSALGQKRTCAVHQAMSALCQKADIDFSKKPGRQPGLRITLKLGAGQVKWAG